MRPIKGKSKITVISKVRTVFLWSLCLAAQPAAWAQAGGAPNRLTAPLPPGQNPNGLRIFLWAGLKSHSVGQHDYPQFLADWSKLLTEKGAVVNGRGDTPNIHDILTGSTPDGRLAAGDKNMTCANWTSSGEGQAMVGHHDRMGLDELPPAKSWNSSHETRGCSQDQLKATGGGGLFYCFAAN